MCRKLLALVGVLLFLQSGNAAVSDARLATAVKNGDRAAWAVLIKDRQEINKPLGDGTTALHWAADRDDVDLIRQLISAGANANSTNELGATALWVAASRGNLASVRALLSAKANPNTALISGESALMAATDRGSVPVAQALLDAGADANAAEKQSEQTALMWASAGNYAEIVRELLNHKADPNLKTKTGFTALLFAAQQGSTESAKLLLDAGANMNTVSQKEGLTPLSLSIASGHEDFPALLIARGADPNIADNRGYTALHYAAAEPGKVELVRALIARGANLNARIIKDPPRANEGGYALPGATPVFMAARIANLPAVKALLDAGADPLIATERNTTPFAVACGVGFPQDRDWYESEKKDFLEIAKLLADRGAKIDMAGENGWTPLHGAAYKGLDEIIKFLVSKGASLETKDAFGQTPLVVAGALQTVEIGDHFYQSPRIARKQTYDLLLSLGARTLQESGVHLVDTATSVE